MSAHKFPCPACGLLLKLPGIAPGKKAKCPQCQGTFTVPEPVTASASAAGNPPPRKAPGTMPGVGPRPGEEKRAASSPPTAAPAIRKTAPTIPGISLPALENPLSIPDKAPPPAAPKISCPQCQKMLRPPPGLPPGKNIRCPHCTGVFPLPGEAKSNGVASVPAPSLPAATPTPPVPPPAVTPLAGAVLPAAPAKTETPPKISVPKGEPEPRKAEPEPITSEAPPETSISEQPLAAGDQSATETVDDSAPAPPSARRLKRVTCPECGTRLKPAKPVRVGRKITCAKCAVVFTVPDDASAVTTEEAADQPPSEAEMHLDDDDETVPSEKQQVAALAKGPQAPLLRLAWSLVALAGGFLIGSIVLFVLVEMGVFTKNAPAIPVVNAETPANPAPPADPVAVAPVGSWREFTSDEGGFTIDIPGMPKERARRDPKKNMHREYIVQGEDSHLSYAVILIDYADDQTLDGQDEIMVRLPQSVASRNKIIGKRELAVNGYPGLEVIGEGARGGAPMTQIVRGFQVKNRLYRLSASSPKERADEAGLARFLDSFKVHEPPLTDEQRAAYDQERRVLKSIRDQKVDVRIGRGNDRLQVTLGGIHVKDEHLALLPTLSNMDFLRLEKTPITDAGLAHLKGPTALAEIDLRSTAIGDLGIKHLKELTGLKILGLGGTRIGDAGLAHLPVFTQLQHLGLGDNPRIGDAGVAHLGKLAKLTLLALYNTDVGDSGVEHLKGLKELEYLDLSGTKVTDAGLAHLNALPRLTTLKLNRTRVTDAGVQLLLKNHPALRIER